MIVIKRLKSSGGAFSHDLLMVPLAWMGAYWLRFNLSAIPDEVFQPALEALPVVMVVQGLMAWHFGLYRGVWRFASVPDLLRILKAIGVGIALSAVTLFLFTRMEGIPRSIFPLYALLLGIFLGGPRLIYRWLKEHHLYQSDEHKVLIVGAGHAGEMLIRDLRRDRGHGYSVVTFVDDDREKSGQEIHGVRVAGRCGRIPRLVKQMGIDLILLAVPTANSRQMRRLVGLCEKSGVPFRTLPRMQDLVSGRAALKELREVSIEDLLGREPVALDWDGIRAGISGKVVLVSGGGGSIGSELCRQIAGINPAVLVVLDNSEYNLYRIEGELQERFPQQALHVCLCDVGDAVGVERVFTTHRPDFVFHAAAYKHVPMLETRLRQAVRNNVRGTRNLAEAAIRHGVSTFLLISTDKAVNPTNVMGASKRVAELFCQGKSSQGATTHFVTVRFGNVLDSAGSVVPLFRRQIAAGGPVTVTHPKVTRYFMTIPEACQLIMEASVVGKGGEIFVLDMGEPIRISYLAEQMIALSGKILGEEIEIIYTGLRPGEKMFEELFHEQEGLTATGRDKLLLARCRERHWDRCLNEIMRLIEVAEGENDKELDMLLNKLVPEFSRSPQDDQSNVVPLEQVQR